VKKTLFILWAMWRRPVFNNMSLPPGVKSAPSCELCHLGGKFTPSFTPRGEHYCLEGCLEEQRILPPGDKFTPRGQSSPQGDNQNIPAGCISPLRDKACQSDCQLWNGQPISYFVWGQKAA
jgi:hypothetical protein